jgi:outer membrane protein assembly factor BamA
MSFRSIYLTIVLVQIISFTVKAQDSIFVQITCPTCEKGFLNQIPKGTIAFYKAEKILSRLLFNLQLHGFFEASAKSFTWNGNNYEIHIVPGTSYEWERLNLEELPASLVWSQDNLINNITGNFDLWKLQKLSDHIISHSENTGFPFATLRFSSVTIKDYRINATLLYDAGPLITFDTIKTNLPENISTSFLAGYLNIVPGSPYNQRAVDQIEKKISGLPYLHFNGKTTSFQNQEATIVLDLESVQANRFEGILGFAPNQNNNNGVLLTGQVDFLLHNLFRSGKSFGFQWRRLKASSQYLNVAYQHPRIFSSALDGNFSLNLLKHDSSFVNRNVNFSLGLDLNHSTYLQFITEYRFSNSLLQAGDGGMAALPDFKWLSYGGTIGWNNLDHIFFPKKGASFYFKSLIGNKITKMQNQQSRAVQLLLVANFENHLPLTPRFILYNQFTGGYLNSRDLSENDFFQIGGLNGMRGFNENEFFASRYILSTIEARYFFEEKSYLMAFYDQGLIATSLLGKNSHVNPSGLGVGSSLNIRSGILKLAYAFGFREGQSFSVGRSKLHFGFETIF